MTIKRQMPDTCSVCDGTPFVQSDFDGGWWCKRCWSIWKAGDRWIDARERERSEQKAAYAAIVQAYADGYPETTIASLMNVDRMTVRRALGKR